MPKCIAHERFFEDECIDCENEAVAAAEDVSDDGYTEYAWSGSDY